MKADLLPTRLDIPSWVPEPIAQWARARHATEINSIYYEASKEDVYLNDAIVEDELADRATRYLPLVRDRRMQSVWRELYRRRNGAFLYPARSGDQDAALIELINTALMCRIRREATTTRSEIEQERDRFLARADQLLADILTLEGKHVGKLFAAAQAYRDHANEIYASNSTTALERRHDGGGRWVALTISDKFRELFDQPMYGLTATITSVILDRDIKTRTVRKWCGNPPRCALRRPKIAS
jgi:hypothetical protein